jgi:hypothetical protein
MSAFVKNGADDIDSFARVIAFEDTSPEKWYDRYINACFTEGIMSGAGGAFFPERPLTLGEACVIIGKLSPGSPELPEITPESRDKAVSYALWLELFINGLETGGKRLSDFGIYEREFTVLATADNNIRLKEGRAVTDAGPLTHFGISLADYTDKSIGALVKDDELLAVTRVVSAAAVIKNAYVVRRSSGAITVFSGGAERTYACSPEKLGDGLICDITVSGKNVLNIEYCQNAVFGVIKRVDGGVI